MYDLVRAHLPTVVGQRSFGRVRAALPASFVIWAYGVAWSKAGFACEIVRIRGEDSRNGPPGLWGAPAGRVFASAHVRRQSGSCFVSESGLWPGSQAMMGCSQAGLRQPGALATWGVMLGRALAEPVPALTSPPPPRPARGGMLGSPVALHARFARRAWPVT